MRELPVDAKVFCRDGEAGQVTDVVVDPHARAVTHIVVREGGLAGREFLVPLEKVSDSSRARVQLTCTVADLSKFPEFTTTRYVPASSPEAQPVIAQWEMETWTNSYGYEPIYLPAVVYPEEQVPIVEDLVPPGELAFQRGARVESSDGQDVGEVAAFVFRLEDGTVSHFVMSTGDRRELTLPLSTVNPTGTGGVVYLTLTKAQIDKLPGAPSGGRYSPGDSDPDALHLLSVVFDAPERAEEALRLAKANEGHLEAAVVRKGADGKITSRETHDITTGRGAAAGVVIGGVLSLVGGPLGPLAGAAVGGAAGGLVGKAVDRGVPDRYVRDLGRALRAGSSALVVVVPQREEASLLAALTPLGGTVLRLQLSDEMIARLAAADSG
jgi:uncharacterized membrane protein/sporulation protein YlmC with PRC-barrel domain